ncbi:hypothetical protein [Paraburkholderia atlantica]|uniref:hypothetical protein n=1 Tax=Paraburkholderia atlantica TaxID=2654982 RepID=UPI0018503B50|nr:hypothetical protein [Paraburkholderia atlantica]MBB5510779.1 hypothetical protein [Paraburkholderia atlantica]
MQIAGIVCQHGAQTQLMRLQNKNGSVLGPQESLLKPDSCTRPDDEKSEQKDERGPRAMVGYFHRGENIKGPL